MLVGELNDDDAFGPWSSPWSNRSRGSWSVELGGVLAEEMASLGCGSTGVGVM